MNKSRRERLKTSLFVLNHSNLRKKKKVKDPKVVNKTLLTRVKRETNSLTN